MRARDRRRLGAAVVVVAVAGGFLAGTATDGDDGERRTGVGSDGRSHLWVDAHGGACRRAGEPGPHVAGDACASLADAYARARPGDTVLVRGGTYPGQLLEHDAGKDSPEHVVLAAAPGERVKLERTSPDGQSLQLGRVDGSAAPPRHLTLRGFTLADAVYLYPGAVDVALVDIRARKFYLRCSHDVRIRRGRFSDEQATGVPVISGAMGFARHPDTRDACPDDATVSSDVTIEGTRFERIWRPDGSGDHRECLHVMGVDGLTIRRSRFVECLGNTAAVSINADPTDAAIDGVVIEDSLFRRTYRDGDCCPRPTGEGAALNLSRDAEGYDVVFRGNRVETSGGIVAQAAPGPTGIVVERNYFDRAPACELAAPDYTWRDNVARAGTWPPACDDGGNAASPAGS